MVCFDAGKGFLLGASACNGERGLTVASSDWSVPELVSTWLPSAPSLQIQFSRLRLPRVGKMSWCLHLRDVI